MFDDQEMVQSLMDDGPQMIRAKWSMDEAKTLSEAAKLLREYAGYLEELEQHGWQLIDQVEDDYGFIVKEGVEWERPDEDDEDGDEGGDAGGEAG